MIAKLYAIAAGTLGTSEAVQLERLRLLGVAISCAASVLGAWLAYQSGREAREAKREAYRLRREQRTRRRVVRDPDTEHALVVDVARVEPEPERAHDQREGDR